MKMLEKLRSAAGPNVGLLLAVALVSSAATGVTAAASGFFAGSPLVACAVPDAGVLYQASDGVCEEEHHEIYELPTAGAVDSLVAAGDAVLAERLDSLAAVVEELPPADLELEYVLAQKSVAPGQGADVFAACPAGKYPIGGGFEKLGDDNWVTGSYPDIVSGTGGSDTWGWMVGMRNPGDDTITAESVAICAAVSQPILP